ncbi:MAG: DsbA family protein [Candidatus Eremiobacteraeota bacterium]|nr:DsbA family protein [Candidatus Eremiobacteraeota bacterium]
MKITFYYDVCSQWSYFADLTLDRLREKYGEDLMVEWQIAMVKDGEAIGYSPEALGWMYRRSESIAGIAVTSQWIRGNDRTLYANLAVAAAKHLGHDVRRQVAEAILLRGEPLGSQAGAVAVVSQLTAVQPAELETTMRAVEPQVRQSTKEFRGLPVTVVPAFLIRNEIGDTALLSGLYEFETLDQVVAEMFRAEHGYAVFGEANAPIPT